MKERYFACTDVKAGNGAEIGTPIGRVYYGDNEGPVRWRDPATIRNEAQPMRCSREQALAIIENMAGAAVARGDYEHIAVLDVSVDYFAQQVSSHRRP